MLKNAPVPVTIITGFLGSGKSTLLNNILTDTTHGRRFAVIENELGDISIDHHLVKQSINEEQIIEVTNGCICCNIRGDLVETLKKLYSKVKKFDGILIETTGLADPAPIVQTFFHDKGIMKHFRLDGVVTVVDGKHILERLNEKRTEGTTNEALEHIAFADKVLLNKVDLVPDEKSLIEIEDEVDAINPTVDILRTEHGKIDPMQLIDIGGFDLQRALGMDQFFLKKERKHRKDSAVTNVCCEIEGEVNLEMLQQWIRVLLTSENDESAEHNHDKHNETILYRYKGIIAVKGMDSKFVFQGVGMMFNGGFAPEHETDGRWGQDEKRLSQFVFIGRNLDHDLLRKGFDACRVTKELRFKVGDTVEANCGVWKEGKVIQQWDEGNAYRIQITSRWKKNEIWAPLDIDEYIRRPRT